MEGPTMDIKSAIAFCHSINRRNDRAYAERLLAYYRDYGTPRASAWPFHLTPKSDAARVRIDNAIRHYMVGDCDIRGTAVRKAS
jgi:hypothetical protein